MGVDVDEDRVRIICLMAFSSGRMLSSKVTSPLVFIITHRCLIFDTFFMPVAHTVVYNLLSHINWYEHAFL